MSLTRNCNELNTSILDQVEDDKIDKEIEETSDLKGDTGAYCQPRACDQV